MSRLERLSGKETPSWLVQSRINVSYSYTLTYTPGNDRILPTPSHLHVKVKNTSPIPLRAAFVHGPYSLHIAAYGSNFSPNKKVEDPEREGVPEFEPILKAGAHWTCKLNIPEEIRETGASFATADKRRSGEARGSTSESYSPKSATWIIEVASQILFSNSASVHFELLVGRDERSLELGFAAVAGHGHGGPGQLNDHHKDKKKEGHATKGVYSRAVKLLVEDTAALWDKPQLPSNREQSRANEKRASKIGKQEGDHEKPTKQVKRKIHLVVLTHGIHSNLSADMLYLKESIDATVRQARLERRRKKQAQQSQESAGGGAKKSENVEEDGAKDHPDKEEPSTAPLSGGQEDFDEYDEDEEQVIVRGFTGNAIKTEKGIQYLGKRMAKYVMKLTYPDQPFLPVKKSMTRSFSERILDKKDPEEGSPSHNGSTIHKEDTESKDLPYTFTSISFIGHSLGGLIQMYAIAYIQKHAPDFFKQVNPVNFICMATPLLGLSNENPMYVKFALDFGLVGRTGQDLGLTWRPPTIAKSGWGAVVSGLTSSPKEQRQENPGAKPLLRILPTGPAHQVLHLFRNRTVYSNVVNDGIVPLRTSCLLFLDWKGLGRVDKARRENGFIGTMAEWGWAELSGASSGAQVVGRDLIVDNPTDGRNTPTRPGEGDTVPQPSDSATEDDNKNSGAIDPSAERFLQPHGYRENGEEARPQSSGSQGSSVFEDIINFFRPQQGSQSSERKSPKASKAMRRGQTLSKEEEEAISQIDHGKGGGTMDNPTIRPDKRPLASRGYSVESPTSQFSPPPKTSIFESASDILHPPRPSTAWITDPSSRKKTIFHDRVYHPEDIPPPPVRRPTNRLGRSFSSDAGSSMSRASSQESIDFGSMKVEEKIARAYHRDLSWRKVLVSLEPDAHNNMIVRRMFANAYGWPVVKHVCDTHFADTWTAQTRDEDEPAVDRAKGTSEKVSTTGEEVHGQKGKKAPRRNSSDMREDKDELGDLDASTADVAKFEEKHKQNRESGVWDDAYFEGSEDDDDEEDGYREAVQRFLAPKKSPGQPRLVDQQSTSRPITAAPSEGHRGLGLTNIANEAGLPDGKPLASEGAAIKPATLTDQIVQEPQSISATGTNDKLEVAGTDTSGDIGEQPIPPDASVVGHRSAS